MFLYMLLKISGMAKKLCVDPEQLLHEKENVLDVKGIKSAIGENLRHWRRGGGGGSRGECITFITRVHRPALTADYEISCYFFPPFYTTCFNTWISFILLDYHNVNF